MTQLISHFVASAGLAAVLVLMILESCGIWVPSEVVMPLAGYFVSQGQLNFVGVVLAGSGGNLIGSLLAYGLAARFGEPLLLGPGRRIGISRSHLQLAEGWFNRWGMYAVFVGRILPVLRTYISFPAGLARLKLLPFSILTFLGSLPWCLLLAWVGVVLGSNYDRVSGPIQEIAIVLGIALLGLVVWWFVHGRHLAKARADRNSGPASASAD